MRFYLRFEDWSKFLFKLEENKIEHGGYIIKIYTSQVKPEVRDTARIILVDGSPFSSEDSFVYKDRGIWTGDELNSYLKSVLNFELAESAARALFRFSNRDDMQFCQGAMQLKKGEGHRIPHPLEEIDGYKYPISDNKKWGKLHLDIFLPQSLENLFKFLGGRPEDIESPILSFSEARALQRKTK